jgi:hypothetical protein
MKAAATVLTLALAVSAGPQSTQPVAELTATSANVSEPGRSVKIRILRWSTDEERAPLVAALSPAAAPPAAASSEGPPAGAGRNPTPAAAGRGRAGRGRGRGGAAGTPLTPIAAFTAALGRGPTIGYMWTSDITGYSIKYAWHATLPDGTTRIVLASDRRLGAYTNAWKPLAAEASAKATAASAPETDYGFTLLELRVGPKGLIEGKTSLANKVAVDVEAKTVALENYAATAVMLR